MRHRTIQLVCFALLLILTGLGGVRVAAAQDVAEVRKQLDAARQDIDAYRAGGGKSGVPDHPAVKWQETLWAFRETNRGTEAAALATAEAIQLLIRADLRDRAHARVEELSVDDLAWERLAAYLYYEGSASKDFGYVVAKLSEIAAGSSVASIKAAALLGLGRAQRRQGDVAAAVTSLESARAAAPDSMFAKDADGVLYDIRNLSVGLPAPAFSARSRTGRQISSDTLRGTAVVLVFWAST
ncbi:MAG TPA: hypothetical protein VH934_24500 [Xanthobacteraceae bacterium]